MTCENAAKKLGKHGEWAKHLRPAGKRVSAKIIRRDRDAEIRRAASWSELPLTSEEKQILDSVS